MNTIVTTDKPTSGQWIAVWKYKGNSWSSVILAKDNLLWYWDDEAEDFNTSWYPADEDECVTTYIKLGDDYE